MAVTAVDSSSSKLMSTKRGLNRFTNLVSAGKLSEACWRTAQRWPPTVARETTDRRKHAMQAQAYVEERHESANGGAAHISRLVGQGPSEVLHVLANQSRKREHPLSKVCNNLGTNSGVHILVPIHDDTVAQR